VVVEDVFVWKRRPAPGFAATGIMPSLLRLLHERDERVDPRIFTTSGASAGAPDPPIRGISADRTVEGLGSIGILNPPSQIAIGAGARLSRHWPGRLRRFGTIVE